MNLDQEWLKASNDDLKTISKILDFDDLSHIVAFHAQQSIEKSFKAIMESEKIKIPKEHNLFKLKNFVKDTLEINNDDLLDTLNQLYIDSRYPSEFGLLPDGKPTTEEAQEFYEFALSIYEQVKNILEKGNIKS